ncbi:MAG: hypothetical protein A2Y10_20285 [Planctomycetes bacterium GWF2_41_51]|nr:MAG: hypothetical protein A2Y10_20285 [Planctomycetes bacterium GWF2_41_51]HBG25746.1 hypothetical protein [Phycisphaerales bacterium]
MNFNDLHDDSNEPKEYYLSGLPQQEVYKVSLEDGTKLLDGRFTIKCKIGAGRFCSVYKAYDKERDCDIALKIGSFSPIGNSNIEELIKNELDINSRVMDNSHVLRIYDINRCMHEGAVLLLLSMEYADGGSLRDWLEKNKYNIELRQTQGPVIFRQICLGLKVLHEKNIIDLDIKPENILFVKGVVKIADFGLSSLMYSAIHGCGNTMANLWPKMGTPKYMSPEQFIAPHAMDIDFRSDIYSLCVVLYEIIHPECKTPFEGNFDFQRYQHVQVPIPEIITDNQMLKQIIEKGLQKKSDKRYQNIAQLLQDLDGGEAVPEDESNQDSEQIIEELWNEALSKIQEPDFDSAILLCNRIIEIDPNNSNASAALRELNSRFEKAQQFYTAIKNAMDTEPMDDLITLLLEAVNIYPNHPDGHLVQTQLACRSAQYADKMEERIELLRQDNIHSIPSINLPTTNNYPVSNYRPSNSYTVPVSFDTRKWYHKLYDFIRNSFLT